MQLIKVSRFLSVRETWAVGQYAVLAANEMSTADLTARLIKMRQHGMRLPNYFTWQVEKCKQGRMLTSYPFLLDARNKPFFWPPVKFPKLVDTLLDKAIAAYKAGSYFLDVWTPMDKFVLYFRKDGLEGLQFIPGDDSASAQWFDFASVPSAAQAFSHPVLRRYLSHIDQFPYSLRDDKKGWKIYANPHQDA